ncbi:hypothetical protein [Thalassotalea euphylliae]|uniref:Uncharacterized protein n=1 Tax=Thalassotalea euphylliae TaxID=1655234 RepID=A0A3E0U2K7_9GAMM|nr:hypothetical protein [Thalassotalea euphylliae]REL30954.1 hypothetical protein DXX94_09600 [Thalassotalea euphylliae]
MFAILMDDQNIVQVFEKYSVPQALEVKHHFTSIFQELKLPSAELVAQMEAEGLSVNDLDSEPVRRTTASNDLPGSVIRSNLYRMFLSRQELLVAIEGLSFSQRLAVRDNIEQLASHLKLPSPELMKRMAAEGIDLPGILPAAEAKPGPLELLKRKGDILLQPQASSDDHRSSPQSKKSLEDKKQGVSQHEPEDKAQIIRNKLSTVLSMQIEEVSNETSEVVGSLPKNVAEFSAGDNKKDKVLAIKNRLNALSLEQTSEKKQIVMEHELEIEGSAAKKFLLSMMKT